ncbi:hypothetical protein Dalk_3547 [Desulfatibacillum aliphaticivorans]|uniref:Uncharacterized protein n=1 Tax=Desulfatibacillum aliphaticivorans TaxID=218208 RepID=B8FC30_DESAL|nr:hypothetical protein [Desulfatibacillum aliphaticivorans]ACL05235.1 hypothetical protein Dalk_3547 [Desulfatibacillum aliphaticivorans]
MEKSKCRAEFGDYLSWACGKCHKAREEDLHPYTQKLFRIRALQKAGYPFRANDLALEEWLDLAAIEVWINTPPPKG